MTKKEDTKSGNDFLQNMGLDFVYNASRKLFDSLIDTVQESVYEFTKRLTHFAISYVLFLAGIILVLVSAMILLNEYLELSYGWSTLSFGIVFILIAFIMRVSIKQKR
ncbi:MAG: hypothetical protein ACOCQG_01645 [Candidatus Nanoarchaeia archaeon]